MGSTQIAIDALRQLGTRLTEKLPSIPRPAVVSMVERYWSFMLERTPLYRLGERLDEVPIDKTIVGRGSISVQSVCGGRATAAWGKRSKVLSPKSRDN
jgi:hypothetical protein